MKLTSPVSKLIRINIGETFSIMIAHERRHVLQAKRISEMPGLPR
jgi:hypothetical protein